MTETLVPFHKLPADVSRMTLSRWMRRGVFPSPAETIEGRRYWSAADVAAWERGKRSGWPPDAGAAARRDVVLERTHGKVKWKGKAA